MSSYRFGIKDNVGIPDWTESYQDEKFILTASPTGDSGMPSLFIRPARRKTKGLKSGTKTYHIDLIEKLK